MSSITTEGLVLRSRLYSETSLIVQWFTRDQGRISTIAKGANRPKSSFRGKIDLFFCAHLSYQPSRRSNLHTLTELILIETFPHLRRDLSCLNQAVYAARFLELATETGEPLPRIYDLVVSFLHSITSPAVGMRVLLFELRLLDQLGLGPSLEQTNLSDSARNLLSHCRQNLSASEILPAPDLDHFSRFLHGFIIYHLGKLPPGRDSALCP